MEAFESNDLLKIKTCPAQAICGTIVFFMSNIVVNQNSSRVFVRKD